MDQEIAHLRDLDLKGLRARWRSVIGRDAPPHLSRHLLFAMLAYRIQAEALSDLDAETIRLLKKLELPARMMMLVRRPTPSISAAGVYCPARFSRASSMVKRIA